MKTWNMVRQFREPSRPRVRNTTRRSFLNCLNGSKRSIVGCLLDPYGIYIIYAIHSMKTNIRLAAVRPETTYRG